MPLELETRRNNFGLVQKAIRLRAKDYDNETLTRREEDARVATLLQRSSPSTKPGVLVNQPVSSNQFREYLRDARFMVALNNLQLNDLEADIRRLARKSLNSIERIQKDIDALDSLTHEQELRIYKQYDYVHYNAFTRERDMALSLLSPKWLTDFKTELSFDQTQHLNIIPGAGATLPVVDRVVIPFIGAELVGEETDMGDTSEPILSTDPRYIFLPGKVFRHVIIRREHDDSGRVYPRTPSYCTILLELPGVQLINFINLTFASGTSVLVHTLSYINEANEERDVEDVEVAGDSGLVFLFAPVRARYIKVKLSQYCPITKLGREQVDLQTRELNRLLEGLTWSARIDETSEYIEGRVFDFSVRNMRAGLNQYLSTGVFRSKDQKIRNLASVSIKDSLELIADNVDTLPSEDAFTEYYLGVDVRSPDGAKLLEDLLPIPDEYPNQVEFLPIIGGEGRLKLLPDLTWNLSKNRILSVTSVSYPVLEVTTESAHGFSVGDEVGVLGPANHPFVGTHVVTATPGSFTFRVVDLDPHDSSLLVHRGTTPRLYVYAHDTTENDINNPPITVYENGTELAIGDKYQINFGTTNAWASTFPKGVELSEVLEDPRSGKLRIKILNPSYDAVYWVEYRPYPNQFLGKTKLVRLVNGRVVFDKRFRRSNATINVVAVMRSDFSNPYTTPVLRSYTLKVRQYGGR